MATRRPHAFECEDPDLMTAVKVVAAYRTKFSRVKQFWYDMETAALRAARHIHTVYPCGKVSWVADDSFLYCVLPSGRRLGYPEPAIQSKMTPWGERKPALTYMGLNPLTRQWQRQHAYGGMLVENATQAVARDLLAEGLLRCEQSGVYLPVLSVHDENLAEANVGAGSVEEFCRLMTTTPAWAVGLPVIAEGWRGPRYKK